MTNTVKLLGARKRMLLSSRISELHRSVHDGVPALNQRVTVTCADFYHDLRQQLIGQGLGLELPTVTRNSMWIDFRLVVGQMKAISDSYLGQT